MRDLGLSYAEAAHGIQTALALALQDGDEKFKPKHLRVGIDLRAIDHYGLVELLIAKGVFTLDEHGEYLRLAANDELAGAQERLGVTLR